MTICACAKGCRFGVVDDGEMQLNPVGEMVVEEWLRTPVLRPQVELDAFVVMPNHVHAIVVIDAPVGATRWVARLISPVRTPRATHRVAPTPGPPAGSLGAIVGQFKSTVTRRVVAAGGTAPLWQRNYHEHVIRGERDLNALRDYIAANPARWDEDEYRQP